MGPSFHAAWAGDERASRRFEISFPASAHAGPMTGRLFLMISRTDEPEVRLQGTWVPSPEIIAVNVNGLRPEESVLVDGSALGTPLRSLNDVPDGDYYVQAVLNVYTEFHRADGHVLWLHMDQGEGQQFSTSPGNLYSTVVKLSLSATSQYRLQLREVISPLEKPVDTPWVRHIQLRSELLSHFWGRPMYLGAVVLLPRGYDANPAVHYPVIYYQPEHFRSFPPFEFRTENWPEPPAQRQNREEAGYETGYEFCQSWTSEHFPRMIAVSIQSPTPFSDWSSGVDSANNGPYGQAILTELIPAIERQFRAIRAPYARVLTGKHSGGRAALALQLLHADFFGGVWAFHPWAFNFKSYFGLDIYARDNVYTVASEELPLWARNLSQWLAPPERLFTRTAAGVPLVSFRQAGQHDAVMAGMAGGDPIGADDAIVGPVGPDGYPRPLWDRKTGQIDRVVAEYWREHGDVAYYTQKNWSKIGANLVGKLHVYVGEMDHFYRNYGVRLFQGFLESTKDPHYEGTFVYLPLSGGWQPMTNAQLVRMMADHVARNAPIGADRSWNND
jgi:hypothetical protein